MLNRFIVVAVLLLLPHGSFAQEAVFNKTEGRIRLEGAFAFGGGLSNMEVGSTTTGDSVRISGGGGAGFSATVGYGLTPRFDFDATLGRQESRLTPAVTNAEGTFTRDLILLTLKYKIPTGKKSLLKIGAGFGVYRAGNLDVNTSNAPGGDHLQVSYGDKIGANLGLEYELFTSRMLAFLIGVRSYAVTYRAASVISNGVASRTDDLNDIVRNLNGSGIDLVCGVVKYF